MLSNNRIILKDNTVLRDRSVSLSDFLVGSDDLDIVAAQDAIYIGSDVPFNHRWIEISKPNINVSTLSIDLWDGSAWHPAVDILDRTCIGGATFGQSGIISWVPERFKNWQWADSTEFIPDLSSLKIYGLYWARFTFSANFASATLNVPPAIDYVGHKFATESELIGEYADFASNALKAVFGNTTWDEQLFIATEYIIQELRAKNIVWSDGQILEWKVFKPACVHKTAEIIFTSLGDDYLDRLVQANRAYKQNLNLNAFNIDKNADGRLERSERAPLTQWMGR